MPGISRSAFWLYPVSIFVVLVVTALAYWSGLAGGFVFDDFPNLVHNEALGEVSFSLPSLLHAAMSSDSGPLARPLSMVSFALQVVISGLAPFPLKLVNLVIHLVNGVLVFVLCSQIVQVLRPHRTATRAWRNSLFPTAVTAAWLMAPINLTAVLYVVQRMESLSALFTLLGLLAYMHGRVGVVAGRRGGLLWMVGGLVGGTVLAALAKETGVLLPAYALALEWALFGFRNQAAARWDRRVMALFAAVVVIPGMLGFLATLPAALSGEAYAGRPFSLAERLWTEARVVVDYLSWIVLPDLRALGLHHDDYLISQGWLNPTGTLPAMLLLAGLLALAFWIKDRQPLVSLGIVFFLAGHSLVSTYLPLELVYEHRNYLPSLGVFLALFGVLLLVPQGGARRVAGLALTAGLIGLGGMTTFMRAGEWSDPARLAYIEATRHPASLRANYELGRVLGEQAKDPNGLAYSMAVKSFEVATKLPNAGLLPLQASVMMKARFGRPVEPELWAEMKKVVESGPLASQDITALHALIVCLQQGRCAFPAERLGEVLKLASRTNPTQTDLLTLQANYATNIARDFPLALRLLSRVVALAPRNAQYWENLISLQTALGQQSEASVGLGYLRELNRFGTLDRTIMGLEARLREKGAAGQPGAVKPAPG